ncbi:MULTISPECIES: hypothetical protein [Methylobacteriaceae]|uniref:hypothetical protein n=1 Tax=Methylobacteriaceae TaxID=119045 RepID=UPI0011716321|nr:MULTISPECIES: hypothetical protein [Methylobacteriaceae]GEL42924.1 hypothetical protein MEX01_35150 [Methylorubrum extorquens]
MRQVLAALRAFLAAMAAFVIIAVIESGRIVWKTVRAIVAPQPETPAAEAELEAALAEPVAPAAPRPLLPAEEWGLGALAYLAPLNDGDEAKAACLDEAALAYLDSLNIVQRRELGRQDLSRIGRHLLGELVIPGLPRAPSLMEHQAAEAARTAAILAEGVRAHDARAAQTEVIGEIFDDLLADDPLYRKAA